MLIDDVLCEFFSAWGFLKSETVRFKIDDDGFFFYFFFNCFIFWFFGFVAFRTR
jgi:hypothetical protein